ISRRPARTVTRRQCSTGLALFFPFGQNIVPYKRFLTLNLTELGNTSVQARINRLRFGGFRVDAVCCLLHGLSDTLVYFRSRMLLSERSANKPEYRHTQFARGLALGI